MIVFEAPVVLVVEKYGAYVCERNAGATPHLRLCLSHASYLYEADVGSRLDDESDSNGKVNSWQDAPPT